MLTKLLTMLTKLTALLLTNRLSKSINYTISIKNLYNQKRTTLMPTNSLH